jgi:hypothetical protein
VDDWFYAAGSANRCLNRHVNPSKARPFCCLGGAEKAEEVESHALCRFLSLGSTKRFGIFYKVSKTMDFLRVRGFQVTFLPAGGFPKGVAFPNNLPPSC